jgi:lipoate-protein ligase A
MAADETLLESALAGVASLRFYDWSEPTLSIGYFQPAAARDGDRRLARLPLVRRPTGGHALVHHYELTYALALPADAGWQAGEPWATRMHGIIAAALDGLGVATKPDRTCPPAPFTGTLCFKHHTPGDLVIGSSKVVGSAQRRRRGALLQHGAVLLMVSPFAPNLAGLKELTNLALSAPVVREAVAAEFVRRTSRELQPGDWTEAEMRRIKELTAGRYSQDSWNRKR